MVAEPGGEALECNDNDWVQVVAAWEETQGFGFAKTSLPVPLMPPFDVVVGTAAEGGVLPQDASIAAHLESEVGKAGGAARSVSFSYDHDFFRNLRYHAQLLAGAREMPHFIVEDASFSHPVAVNQAFLTAYVKAWHVENPHVVWVHNTELATLIARHRCTTDFWKFCTARAPVLQASVGDTCVVSAKAPDDSVVSRIASVMLTITSSAGPECLQMWDGVWCVLVALWDQSLPKPPATDEAAAVTPHAPVDIQAAGKELFHF